MFEVSVKVEPSENTNDVDQIFDLKQTLVPAQNSKPSKFKAEESWLLLNNNNEPLKKNDNTELKGNDLYINHEVKEEMVIGPTILQGLLPVVLLERLPEVVTREILKDDACQKKRVNSKSSCNICKKNFMDSIQLKLHKCEHSVKKCYKCEICDKTFEQKSHLNRHITCLHIHTKPHKCNICNKGFIAKCDLKKHCRMHNGVRPYKCEFCNKDFKQPAHLSYHVISKHSDIKPYECKICNKSFVGGNTFKYHMQLHTGERPYRCEHCDKEFLHVDSLKFHFVTMHPDTYKKYLKCNVCNKRFVKNSRLQRHMTVHSTEKPYVCNVCHRSYKTDTHLKNVCTYARRSR